MFQIRLHGRGGQGVVTGAEMLSIAAFLEGKHAQAFPSFGSERTGAPVVSYCRIADKEIRSREPVLEPDAVIVQDPTLFQALNVFEGLKPTGYVLVNSTKSFEELGVGEIAARLPEGHMGQVGATELAVKHVGRPAPNACLLGGLAAMTGWYSLASVEAAISKKFPGKVAAGNIAAAQAAHEIVSAALKAGAADKEPAHA